MRGKAFRGDEEMFKHYEDLKAEVKWNIEVGVTAQKPGNERRIDECMAKHQALYERVCAFFRGSESGRGHGREGDRGCGRPGCSGGHGRSPGGTAAAAAVRKPRPVAAAPSDDEKAQVPSRRSHSTIMPRS